MSERKVLNKYYPPDFDPSKIPRMKLPKNRQYTVRLMAPFNMRCTTCGEYIYKGKKFNARKEDVENETYLGIRIYRFYIKCTRCLQEISFKTDPQNTDYEIEAGATRNFMALKLAEEQAIREEKEAREEEANNPMKLLENRTQQSRNEIEVLESLEELKDLNRRQHVVNYDEMLSHFNREETEEERQERIKREDEAFIKSVTFRNKSTKGVVAEEIIEEIVEEEDSKEPPSKMQKPTETNQKPLVQKPTKNKNPLSNLVKLKSQFVKPIARVKDGTTEITSKATDLDGTSSSGSELPSSSDKSTTLNEIKSVTSTSGKKPDLEQTSGAKVATPNNALNMLAAYSDSSENSD